MKKKILALAISAALITTSVPTMATQVFAEGITKVVSEAKDLLAPRGEKKILSSGSCGNTSVNDGNNVLYGASHSRRHIGMCPAPSLPWNNGKRRGIHSPDPCPKGFRPHGNFTPFKS